LDRVSGSTSHMALAAIVGSKCGCSLGKPARDILLIGSLEAGNQEKLEHTKLLNYFSNRGLL